MANDPADDTVAGPFVTPSGGHGLLGLDAQVVELGGCLEAGPCGVGWRVHARLPLRVSAGVDGARRLLVAQRRRTRRMLIAVPVATAAVIIAVPVGAVLGQAALSRIDPADFADITIGEAEDSARSRLPIVEMEAPPSPVGSGACQHYESTFSPFERTEVYEVCFTDGRVSSARIIPAP